MFIPAFLTSVVNYQGFFFPLLCPLFPLFPLFPFPPPLFFPSALPLPLLGLAAFEVLKAGVGLSTPSVEKFGLLGLWELFSLLGLFGLLGLFAPWVPLPINP